MTCKKSAINCLAFWLALLVFFSPAFAFTQDKPGSKKGTKKADDWMFEMSLEELLDEEVVTAGKKSEKISDIPASVVLITCEDIKRYGYKTLEEILENIPGFYMIDSYSWWGTASFGVRGFFSPTTLNNVIILVNGINQVGDYLGDYPSSKIKVPVEAIDRIEGIRGPMSVIYGSGAFMGAINIITDDTGNGSSTLALSMEPEGSYRTAVKLSGKAVDFRYSFSGSISHHKGISEPLSKMTSDTAFLGAVGVSPNADTSGMLEKNHKYFNFSGAFKDLFFQLNRTESKTGIFDGLPSVGDGTHNQTESSYVVLGLTKKYSETFSFKAKLGFYHHNTSFHYNVLFENSYAINHLDTKAYEFTIDTFYHPAAALELTAGFFMRNVYEFTQHYDYPIYGEPYSNYEAFFTTDSVKSYQALYLQSTFKASGKLTLIGGIRFERISPHSLYQKYAAATPLESERLGTAPASTVAPIPRIAVIYALNSKNVLKLLYGEAVKQPSISDISTKLREGAPKLEPAKIKTLELNYIFSPAPEMFVNVSVFHNALNNLIVRRNLFNPETKTWDLLVGNLGKMTTTGVELGVKVSLFKHLTLDLSVTHQESSNKEEGYKNIELGYSPSFLGYAKAIYRFNKTIHLGVTWRYVDDMKALWDNDPVAPEDNDLTPKGRIGLPVPAYNTFNANLRIDDFFKKGIYLAVNISNIFGSEIRYPATKSNQWTEKGTLGMGRTVFITLGLNF